MSRVFMSTLMSRVLMSRVLMSRVLMSRVLMSRVLMSVVLMPSAFTVAQHRSPTLRSGAPRRPREGADVQELWHGATVRHDELVGTAAADWPDSHRDLQRRAGLDDSWLVVALELSGSYRASRAAVLAVPTPPSGIYVDWASLLDQGRLQVRRFPLEGGDAYRDLAGGLGMLTELKRWSVRLVIQALRDVPLVVLVEE